MLFVTFNIFASFSIFLYSIDISKLVQTEYSSEVTKNSHKCTYYSCSLLDYSCEVIEIHTIEEGYYSTAIVSETGMHIVGYAYENNFTLFALLINAIETDSYFYYMDQLQIPLYRQMNTSFILVVASYTQHGQGVFSIIVSGPSNVSMKRTRRHSFYYFFHGNFPQMNLIQENSRFIEK